RESGLKSLLQISSFEPTLQRPDPGNVRRDNRLRTYLRLLEVPFRISLCLASRSTGRYYRHAIFSDFSRHAKNLLRKEVIQPQVPLRLPCYDFTPVTNPTFNRRPLAVGVTVFWLSQLPWCDGRCVQGPGTYSPRRADPRLLAIPTSWSRVADSNPNWDWFFGISSTSRFCDPLYSPL